MTRGATVRYRTRPAHMFFEYFLSAALYTVYHPYLVLRVRYRTVQSRVREVLYGTRTVLSLPRVIVSTIPRGLQGLIERKRTNRRRRHSPRQISIPRGHPQVIIPAGPTKSLSDQSDFNRFGHLEFIVRYRLRQFSILRTVMSMTCVVIVGLQLPTCAAVPANFPAATFESFYQLVPQQVKRILLHPACPA